MKFAIIAIVAAALSLSACKTTEPDGFPPANFWDNQNVSPGGPS